MPDVVDIIGFVASIISLAELAELCELLERIERVGHPDGKDAIRRLRRSLKELDARITTTWLDVDKWKARGVVRRYRHWTERVGLSRRCSALSRDVEELRAHLHALPPPHTHASDDDRDAHAPGSKVSSSCTLITCESSATAISVSSAAGSSPEPAFLSPKTPASSLGPDPAPPPTYVEAADSSGDPDHDDGHKRQPATAQELHDPAATQSWIPDGRDQHASAVDPFKSGDSYNESRARRPHVARDRTQQPFPMFPYYYPKEAKEGLERMSMSERTLQSAEDGVLEE
ncbi:hypothetical protein VTO73DRAFT_12090 [Trametes versicolor]